MFCCIPYASLGNIISMPNNTRVSDRELEDSISMEWHQNPDEGLEQLLADDIAVEWTQTADDASEQTALERLGDRRDITMAEESTWLQNMAAIQTQRQNTLRFACEKYANQTFLPLEKFVRGPRNMVSLIYNDKYRVIYNFVHKAASQHLVKLFNTNSSVPKDKIYTENRLYRLSKAGALTRLRHYKKFIFVRDPFARFVSVYRNKFVDHPLEPYFRNVATNIISRYRKDKVANKSDRPTFPEFIDYITGYDDSRRANTHWSSYVTRNKVCLMEHDFIGTLETMEDDFTYLFHHLLKIGKNIKIPQSRSGTTTGNVKLIKDMYAKVSAKSLQKLKNYYVNDFLVFGYNIDL